MTLRVGILGASGFVGSAVTRSLSQDPDVATLPLRAPRLTAPTTTRDPRTLGPEVVRQRASDVTALTERLRGLDVLVNCAGDPEASSRDWPQLATTNADLVAVAAQSAHDAGLQRFVHVSSAVVQGRAKTLTDTFVYDPFSDYARSKILGEVLGQQVWSDGLVIYRPPSVHDASRRVTKMTARIARSKLSSIAAPSDAPTPQALIDNVASAVAFLAVTPKTPPPVVIHPWEGLTTSSLLELLGGKKPRVILRPVAKALVAVASAAGRLTPQVAANARRLEMIWFGQRQDSSWLTEAGWTPPASWESLPRQLSEAG